MAGVETALEPLPAPFPQLMQDRLEESLRAAAEKAFLGRSLEDVRDMTGWFESSLTSLYRDFGFQAVSFRAEVGRTAHVALTLAPSGPVIRTVSAHALAPGAHPNWKDPMDELASRLEGRLTDLLAGLPVTAQTWATEPAVSAIAALPELRELFAGYEVIPQIYFDEHCDVTLRLRPAGPTVRLVAVKMTSRTIPSLALDQFKSAVASHSEFLIGLPIAFLEANEERLEPILRDLIGTYGIVRDLRLVYSMRFTLGRSALIHVDLDSLRYAGFLRAELNLGRTDNNPNVKARFGGRFFKRFELFGETHLQPGPMTAQMSVGAGLDYKGDFFIGAGREFKEGFDRLWVSWHPIRELAFSWEEGAENDRNEGAVTFRAHEFFSLEAVSDFNNDVWLRFVMNL